jgi:hypothetical protein
MERSPDQLRSPGLLLALLLLLLNDLYLKEIAGTGAAAILTGKLSDFAGLFVFAVFWSVLLPRWRAAVHILTAAGFVWWKSPLSQPFVDAFNAGTPMALARTVDWTDLIALVVLPVAYRYVTATRYEVQLPRLRWAVVPVTLFAFGATSFLYQRPMNRTYAFHATPQQLRASLDSLRVLHAEATDTAGGRLALRVPAETCGWGMLASAHVSEDGPGAALVLTGMAHRCRGSRADSLHLIDAFERCLVLRIDSVLSGGERVRGRSVQFADGGIGRFGRCTDQWAEDWRASVEPLVDRRPQP